MFFKFCCLSIFNFLRNLYPHLSPLPLSKLLGWRRKRLDECIPPQPLIEMLRYLGRLKVLDEHIHLTSHAGNEPHKSFTASPTNTIIVIILSHCCALGECLSKRPKYPLNKAMQLNVNNVANIKIALRLINC